MNRSFAFPISEVNQIGEARRMVTSLARDLKFSSSDTGIAALIVTELAQNLVKYAKGGQLVMRTVTEPGAHGLEVLSLDSGPGMTDVPRSLADGYSTSGTPGTGLGAVRRNSSIFDIYSSPILGTAIVSRIIRGSRAGNNERLDIGVVCVPLAGQDVCGDGWMVLQDAHHAAIMVVDGLGHGYDANQASLAAIEAVKAGWIEDIEVIAAAVHEKLKPTRGAVAGIAAVDLTNGLVNYVGIGNISASITTWETVSHLVSMNGTAGLAAVIKSFSYSWPGDGILILTSDGVTNHWKLSAYPGLFTAHPSIVAGLLYQNFSRSRDDATVLAVRWKQG